jgi:hypothetical protein
MLSAPIEVRSDQWRWIAMVMEGNYENKVKDPRVDQELQTGKTKRVGVARIDDRMHDRSKLENRC